MRRSFILAQFLTTPLALLPECIPTVYGVLARWDARQPPSPEARAQVDEDKQARAARLGEMEGAGTGMVAVLPLMGILSQYPAYDVSGPGVTSVDRWAEQFQSLVDDSNVTKIIVPIDSPGGSVYGIQETADIIFQARDKKPVIGIANSVAASAAYWLASQMTEMHVTPGGGVGSIGVRSAIQSIAAQLEKDGIDYRTVAAGKYKAEGDPTQPITDDAVASLQARVDEYYTMFVDAVARGRGVKASAVTGGMGEGRMLGAKAAQAESMVDGITTFRDLMIRHTAGQSTASPSGSRRRRAAAALAIAQLS